MGNPDIRSKVIDENGMQKLVINSDFPTYQANKASGHNSLSLYLGETAIVEIVGYMMREKFVYPSEFMDVVNGLMADFAGLYQLREMSQRIKRERRGK